MEKLISKETIERIERFNSEREWARFHTPENIAKSISIEAAELLECFQWSPDYGIDSVKAELADVLIYCIDMLNVLRLDADEIINKKMEENEKKYPIELSKGNADKYTELKR